jgi:hypothetical protein
LFPKPRIKQLFDRRRNWEKNNGLILYGFNFKIAPECRTNKYIASEDFFLHEGLHSHPEAFERKKSS